MRYKVSGLPPGRSPGAFMPTLTLNGQSVNAGLNRPGIVGFPGDMPVHIDHDMILAPASFDPKTQPSNVAPDLILPTVYIPATRYMGPWNPRGAARTKAPLFGGNPVPEPAGQPTGVAQAVGPRAKVGGSKVIGWPRVSQVWQSVNSSGPS